MWRPDEAFHVAALGSMSRLEAYFAADQPPTSHHLSEAFYQACESDQPQAAKYLLDRGADINWIAPSGEGIVGSCSKAEGQRSALDRPPEGLVEWLICREQELAPTLGCPED
jgi:hypothetical protein